MKEREEEGNGERKRNVVFVWVDGNFASRSWGGN